MNSITVCLLRENIYFAVFPYFSFDEIFPMTNLHFLDHKINSYSIFFLKFVFYVVGFANVSRECLFIQMIYNDEMNYGYKLSRKENPFFFHLIPWIRLSAFQ